MIKNYWPNAEIKLLVDVLNNEIFVLTRLCEADIENKETEQAESNMRLFVEIESKIEFAMK